MNSGTGLGYRYRYERWQITSSRHFPASIVTFLRRLFTGYIRAEEIKAETRAQIEFHQKRGLHLTHINTHMFLPVLRAVLRAARASNIRAVRNPFEPEWAVRATAGAALARVAQVTLLRQMQPVWRKIIAEEGFKTTDGTIAVGRHRGSESGNAALPAYQSS